MANRLIEQAGYFGIDVPHVVEIGERAKQFVEEKLAQPFTFLTRKASGLGRSKIERFYGFVQTKDGDLGELLVANGLARVHGTRAVRPGSSNAAEEIDKLQKLEEKAKTEKLGAWGISTSTNVPQPLRTVGLPSAPPVSRPVASPGPAVHPPVQASPGGPATAAGAKLDVNTATKDELEKLPGIGDSLADR